jgi:hypothetical protein
MAHKLINKQNLRKYILEYAGRTRSHPYTRVADSAYDDLEHVLRQACRKLVQRQPSAGRTIK